MNYRNFLWTIGIGVMSLAGSAGCTQRKAEVRYYEEIVIPPPPASSAAREMNAGAPPGEEAAPPPREAALRWLTPAGWEEKPGSGMRLATFVVTAGPDTAECTIVSFPGDVGGLEANLRRWLGQLNLTLSDDEFRSFLDGAAPFSTTSGLSGKFFDFTSLAGDGGTSMLATVIQLPGAQAFVKLMGPAKLMAAERENFIALNRSIQ